MAARPTRHGRIRNIGQAVAVTAWMILGCGAGVLAWNAMPILEMVSDLLVPPPKETSPKTVAVAHTPRKVAPPNLQRPVVAGYSAAAIQQATTCTTATKPADGDTLLSGCTVGSWQSLARGNGAKADRLVVAPIHWPTTVVGQAAR